MTFENDTFYDHFRVVCGIFESGELRICKDRVKGLEFHAESQVGLVASVFIHRLVEGHFSERTLDIEVFDRLEDLAEKSFGNAHNIFLFDKAHLEVDLGEFRLSVCAESLVTEALRDLIVFVHSSNHEYLLEDLRRLRQSVERTRPEPARNKEISCAARAALDEERSFDFDKIERIEVFVNKSAHFGTRDQVLPNVRFADVDVAVFQLDRVGCILSEIERKRLRRVHERDFISFDFDRACRIFVCSVLFAVDDRSAYRNDRFKRQFFCRFRKHRIAHKNLSHPVTV